jgi:hypothetical protein
MNYKMKPIALIAAIGMISITSCKKDDVPAKESIVKKDLMAHTWQMEKVIEYSSGNPSISFQRGAADNQEDYSMIRQTYKADGSITYIDQGGESGTDGIYELLNNDTKIRIGLASMGLSVIGDNLKVDHNSFGYTINTGDGDSTRFIFSAQ